VAGRERDYHDLLRRGRVVVRMLEEAYRRGHAVPEDRAT
jgi:hypothetical protein